MDALTGLLEGPRARGAFLLRAVLDPPWSVRIQDRAPLSLVVMVHGDAWVVPDHGHDPVHLPPGATAIVKGPDPYTFADNPATPPQVVVHPGQRCTTPQGDEVSEAMMLGVRTWGSHQNGSVVMLIGTYERHSEISRRLLAALPAMAVLAPEQARSPILPLLGEEITTDEPGQEVVLDRLLDLLLIDAVRTWFGRPEADTPAWYRAHADPVVGRALQLLHGNPTHPWTVASLAHKTGVSRAALARRFTERVGEPPMTYLTGWRLALAADLLHEPENTLEAVASQVGYGSGFALSAAFKRVRGISPQEHRVRVTPADGQPITLPFTDDDARRATTCE